MPTKCKRWRRREVFFYFVFYKRRPTTGPVVSHSTWHLNSIFILFLQLFVAFFVVSAWIEASFIRSVGRSFVSIALSSFVFKCVHISCLHYIILVSLCLCLALVERFSTENFYGAEPALMYWLPLIMWWKHMWSIFRWNNFFSQVFFFSFWWESTLSYWSWILVFFILLPFVYCSNWSSEVHFMPIFAINSSKGVGCTSVVYLWFMHLLQIKCNDYFDLFLELSTLTDQKQVFSRLKAFCIWSRIFRIVKMKRNKWLKCQKCVCVVVVKHRSKMKIVVH